ncbi:MAG: TPM domain-containing protein, partial [Rikenellaceae bacterium]
MRIITTILFAILTALNVSAATYTIEQIPNVQLESRNRFVSNPDGILSQQAVAQIDSICYSLRNNGIAQVAIVAVDDISPRSSFDFAYNLFSKWGVGDAGRDNGLGILFVKKARQIRIVTGRGVEGVLPDALCKRIQSNYMLPHFSRGDYSTGLLVGMRSIEAILMHSELNTGADGRYKGNPNDGVPISFILLVMLFVMGVPMITSLISYYRTYRCKRCGKMPLSLVSETRISRGDNFDTMDQRYRCPHCGDTTTKRVRKMRDDIDLRPPVGGVIIGGGLGSRG